MSQVRAVQRAKSRISIYLDLLFNCLKGKETMLGFLWFLPPAVNCYFWCLPEGKEKEAGAGGRLGLWLGPDSKQTFGQLLRLLHRAPFEKPMPSGCTLEAP